MLWEIVDNAVDEAANGFAQEINIILHTDQSVTVEDDGRGIPVENHPKLNVPGCRLFSRSCTQAANLTTATTVFQAGSTALAHPLSMRCRDGWWRK